jgi:hypothetical protein
MIIYEGFLEILVTEYGAIITRTVDNTFAILTILLFFKKNIAFTPNCTLDLLIKFLLQVSLIKV